MPSVTCLQLSDVSVICRVTHFQFLTVKMETRHSVEGQFGSEFPAVCNHCGSGVITRGAVRQLPQGAWRTGAP